MKELKGDNLSKFLSQILRHKPEKIHIELNEFGYADIAQLIQNSEDYGYKFSQLELEQTVNSNDKQRFLIKNGKIKATQGHSFEVALESNPIKPPEILYHGTKFKLKETIELEGIKRMKRNLVHMNEDFEKSISSGSRTFEKPILFEVRSGEMHLDGHEFYKSENDVWLTECINPKYINAKKLSDLYFDYQEFQIKASTKYKILDHDFELISKKSNRLVLRAKNCYFCKDDDFNLSFYKDHVVCGKTGWGKTRKTHFLEGKILSGNLKQDTSFVIATKICQLSMPNESFNSFGIINMDEIFYGIGFNYLCGECNEENSVSNMGKLKEELFCRNCNKKYFMLKEETTIEIKKASNNR